MRQLKIAPLIAEKWNEISKLKIGAPKYHWEDKKFWSLEFLAAIVNYSWSQSISKSISNSFLLLFVIKNMQMKQILRQISHCAVLKRLSTPTVHDNNLASPEGTFNVLIFFRGKVANIKRDELNHNDSITWGSFLCTYYFIKLFSLALCGKKLVEVELGMWSKVTYRYVTLAAFTGVYRRFSNLEIWFW